MASHFLCSILLCQVPGGVRVIPSSNLGALHPDISSHCLSRPLHGQTHKNLTPMWLEHATFWFFKKLTSDKVAVATVYSIYIYKAVLLLEPRSSHMRSEHSTSELQPREMFYDAMLVFHSEPVGPVRLWLRMKWAEYPPEENMFFFSSQHSFIGEHKTSIHSTRKRAPMKCRYP